MKNKIIVLLILFSLFIPFVQAENETNVSEEIGKIETTEELIDELKNMTLPPYEKVIDTQDGVIETVVNGKKLILDDSANLLSEEERNSLIQDMMPITNYSHIAFVTTSTNYSSAPSFADSYYHKNFGTEDGTLFLIDMNNRKIYIFSDGKNYNIINTGRANIITDNVYIYAKRGEYYNCAKKAFEQINTVLSGGKISEPMRYISNIVLSLVVAFFVGFLRVLKNARIDSPTQQEIINGCAVSFAVANIVGTKVGTHSVYVPPSSSSSGGSFHGGGGGGGHSGGGGGHSF